MCHTRVSPGDCTRDFLWRVTAIIMKIELTGLDIAERTHTKCDRFCLTIPEYLALIIRGSSFVDHLAPSNRRLFLYFSGYVHRHFVLGAPICPILVSFCKLLCIPVCQTSDFYHGHPVIVMWLAKISKSNFSMWGRLPKSGALIRARSVVIVSPGQS